MKYLWFCERMGWGMEAGRWVYLNAVPTTCSGLSYGFPWWLSSLCFQDILDVDMPDLPQLGTVNTFHAVLSHFIEHQLFVVVSKAHSFFFQYFIVRYFFTELTQQEVSGNSVDVFNPFRNSEVQKLCIDKQYLSLIHI